MRARAFLPTIRLGSTHVETAHADAGGANVATLRDAIGALGILVATFLGIGAVEELVVRGIRGGEGQPLMVGVAGTMVSMLLGLAAWALWRRRQSARRLAVGAGVAALVFHAYAALPPHRNVGLLALVVAGAYSAALLGFAAGNRSDRGERVRR